MSPGALNWYKQFKVKTSSKWISNFKVSVTKAIYFLLSQAAVFFRLNLSGPRGNRVNSGIIVRGPGKTKSSSAFAFFTDTQSTRAGHRHSVNRQFKQFYMCLNGGRQHQWRFLKQRVRVHPHNCWYVLERGSRAAGGAALCVTVTFDLCWAKKKITLQGNQWIFSSSEGNVVHSSFNSTLTFPGNKTHFW